MEIRLLLIEITADPDAPQATSSANERTANRKEVGAASGTSSASDQTPPIFVSAPNQRPYRQVPTTELHEVMMIVCVDETGMLSSARSVRPP
jgi:hypothetical protein